MNTVPNGYKKVLKVEPIAPVEYVLVTVMDWYNSMVKLTMPKSEIEAFKEKVNNGLIRFDN